MTNSKSTKRALVSSALAVFLCVAMLIGTTFAWFTDTASTSVNTIQAGKLDVVLQMATEWDESGKPTKWKSAEGKTLDFIKANGAADGEAILWEPGCTYKLPELCIMNKENLALKYKVVITGINGDAELNDVIDWRIEDKGETYVADAAKSLAAGESRIFTISGKMQDSARNHYQGMSIEGISITVLAAQDTVEYDSNNNQYDKDAEYPIYVPVGGLDTTTTSGNVTTIPAGDLFEDDEISNAYVIDGGTYWAQDDFATFNDTYSTIWIKDADISCKTLFCAFEENNTIVLSDCNITIAEGGYLIEELSDRPTQIIFANVTINGEKVTSSNFDSMIETYCTGKLLGGFVAY